jgi:hypothetical protein
MVWAWVHPAADLSPELARIVLDAHTITGDVVIDAEVSFAAVVARTGHRHDALSGAGDLVALGYAAGYVAAPASDREAPPSGSALFRPAGLGRHPWVVADAALATLPSPAHTGLMLFLAEATP